jgi:DNA-directed RNA polymerase subunit RPC12/RpoP
MERNQMTIDQLQNTTPDDYRDMPCPNCGSNNVTPRNGCLDCGHSTRSDSHDDDDDPDVTETNHVTVIDNTDDHPTLDEALEGSDIIVA